MGAKCSRHGLDMGQNIHDMGSGGSVVMSGRGQRVRRGPERRARQLEGLEPRELKAE